MSACVDDTSWDAPNVAVSLPGTLTSSASDVDQQAHGLTPEEKGWLSPSLFSLDTLPELLLRMAEIFVREENLSCASSPACPPVLLSPSTSLLGYPILHHVGASNDLSFQTPLSKTASLDRRCGSSSFFSVAQCPSVEIVASLSASVGEFFFLLT